MRLFVCEYVTGGGYAGAPLPAGLVDEGERMLRAIVADAADVAGVAVTTTRDARLAPAGLPATVRPIAPGDDPWRSWRAEIAAADAVWPIAPETDGLLERLSDLVLAAGRTLIGSRPAAVRVAASKRVSAQLLGAAGVPVIPTLDAPGAAPADGWVVKPDDGAGSERTLRVGDRAAARLLAADPGALLQPYVPGAPASLALLCRDGAAWLLTVNSQEIAEVDGRLRYRGGIVGGHGGQRAALAGLADAIAAAIPGLWGYVGVDLIDTAAGPVVVEVNPRVSVPYAGLRAALGLNPAELILRLVDEPLAAIRRPLTIAPTRIAIR